MHLQAIINAAADEADGFLRGVVSASEAKPLIVEWLEDNQPGLTVPDRQKVVQGVLAVLEGEGFFEASAGDGSSQAANLDE